jgi:DNA mismatch repair protein MSH5
MPQFTPTRPKKAYRSLVSFVNCRVSSFAPLNEVCDHQLGILNNTTSSLGRSLLRTWLLRPSLSIPVITARHDAVACFLRPENLVTAAAMHSHLKGIKNVPRILGTIRCGKAGVGQWQGLVKVGDPAIEIKNVNYFLQKFTFHSAMIRDALNELHQAGSVEIVQKASTTYGLLT